MIRTCTGSAALPCTVRTEGHSRSRGPFATRNCENRPMSCDENLGARLMMQHWRMWNWTIAGTVILRLPPEPHVVWSLQLPHPVAPVNPSVGYVVDVFPY